MKLATPAAALLLAGTACSSTSAPPDRLPRTAGHLELVASAGDENRLARLRPGSPLTLDAPRAVSTYPIETKRTGWLVVSSEDGGHREQLARLDASGSLRRLGPAAGRVRNPALSPDGSWAVVESSAESFSDLYRVSAATGHSVRLTRDGDGAFAPSVAPDGRIVFVTTRAGSPDLHTMADDGTGRRALTSGPAHDTDPAFAPDGARIVFVSDRDGRQRLWLLDRSGPPRRATDLAAESRHEVAPSWSPDGERIAYLVDDDRGRRELWVLELASGERRRLGGDEVPQPPLSWSPASDHVAYAARVGDRLQLHLAAADSGDVWQLTRGERDHWLPRWRE